MTPPAAPPARADFVYLRVVTDPDSPTGFDLVDQDGRPVALLTELVVKKGYGPQAPPQVQATFSGIPIDMQMPDWDSYARWQAARERSRHAAARSQPATDQPVPLPPAPAGSPA